MIRMRWLYLSVVLMLIGGAVRGSTVISFTDGGTFDQATVGESMNVTDGAYNFTLTTVDIIGIDGTSVLNDSATHVTSVESSSHGGIVGINSAGSSDSSTRFDHGEAWVIAFNQNITFDSIDLASLDAGDEIQMTILDGSNGGLGDTISFPDSDSGTGWETFTVNKTIAAGTQIRFSAIDTSGSCGIVGMTVTAAPRNGGLTFLLTGKKSLQQRQMLHLYLLIGQSNMAGRGTVGEEDLQADPRVLTLTENNQWVEAVDPIHFDKPTADGVGPGVSFGKTMASSITDTNIVIGLIPCAVGGTSVSQWQKDADPTEPWGVLYSNALVRARTALKDGILKGILWHQGESDSSSNSITAYEGRITQLVSDFRQDLNASDVPFVAGELGVWDDGNPLRADFNANLADLPEWISNSAVVSSEGLSSIGDGTHFDTESQHILGQRYAAAMMQLQEIVQVQE